MGGARKAGAAAQAKPQAAAGPLALKATGAGSTEELQRLLAGFPDATDRATVEAAFRQVFTLDRARRRPADAARSLEPLLERHPKSAAIHRILGYAAVDDGFQVDRAMKHYKAAVALDPDYGEVHYALAFMYAMSDKATGRKHFVRALSLGVADERGIGPRFYPDTQTE